MQRILRQSLKSSSSIQTSLVVRKIQTSIQASPQHLQSILARTSSSVRAWEAPMWHLQGQPIPMVLNAWIPTAVDHDHPLHDPQILHQSRISADQPHRSSSAHHMPMTIHHKINVAWNSSNKIVNVRWRNGKMQT